MKKALFSRAASAAARLTGALSALIAAPMAFATTAGTTDPFYDFMTTVQGWATGAFGVGIATTMLIMGAGIGVAKNSPLPALSGIAGAAILHWGPNIITNVLGAVV